MEEEILKSIDQKLNTVIRLLAANCIQGKKKTEAIITLAALHIDNETIAEIVGTAPGAVRARVSEAKKQRKMGAKKVKKPEVPNE